MAATLSISSPYTATPLLISVRFLTTLGDFDLQNGPFSYSTFRNTRLISQPPCQRDDDCPTRSKLVRANEEIHTATILSCVEISLLNFQKKSSMEQLLHQLPDVVRQLEKK